MLEPNHDSFQPQLLFHPLDRELPESSQLNNPFSYEPDALMLAAVGELQRHLPERPDEGKMWGVLVVEWHGRLGFINAYSGQLSDKMLKTVGDMWAGCSPIFDYLEPDGYFKVHEQEITDINHEIDRLVSDDNYRNLKTELESLKKRCESELNSQRALMQEAKKRRHERRKQGTLSAEENADMVRESQFQKAELHRMKLRHKQIIGEAENKLAAVENEIERLKRRRSLMSDRLQSWLFNQFVLVNGNGERKAMPEIFREYYAENASSAHPVNRGSMICPSGAGECCEPKMLQYAFLHGMRPLRIASFWWGPALGGELRRHRQFYPACNGRCKPILSWMLQGLDVARKPLLNVVQQKLKIIYKDNYLFVVNKPSGMLSVPGKEKGDSVVSIIANKFHTNVFPVHRLDMDTSGLLVVARDADTQRLLRSEFESRQVKKEYEAVVVGRVEPQRGRISLPLSANLLDRPRQKVDFENGKESITDYEVVGTDNGLTRLRLHPLTGRTHQLRVHCASPLGLNAPIKGDRLYGTPDGRLCLQARRLSFVHPVNGRLMSFTLSPDF